MTRRPRPILRFQKTQYARRRFQNPYFRHTPPCFWKKILPWLVLIFLFFSFLLWVVFGSPMFRITQVTLQGASPSSSGELQIQVDSFLSTRRFLFFHNHNHWLFDEESCRSYLEQFYAFETLIFEFIDLHQLFITVQEKTSSFLWETDNHTFVVDLQGTVVREITPTEQQWLTSAAPPAENDPLPEEQQSFLKLPRFRDLNNAPIAPGLVVASREEITSIFSFQQTLTTLSIPFLETQIDRLSGKWIGILTSDGYLVLFDAAGDVQAQAMRLQSVLKESIPDPSVLDYIDLRFGDHVYFK